MGPACGPSREMQRALGALGSSYRAHMQHALLRPSHPPCRGSGAPRCQVVRQIFNLAKSLGFGKPKPQPQQSLNKSTPKQRPGRVSPRLLLTPGINKPPYADSGKFPPWGQDAQVHDKEVRGACVRGTYAMTGGARHA